MAFIKSFGTMKFMNCWCSLLKGKVSLYLQSALQANGAGKGRLIGGRFDA